MTSSGMKSCGDILLVPMGTPGHLTPMMHIVKALMSRSQGRLTATMLLEEGDQDQVKRYLEGEEAIEGLRLQLVESVEHDEPGLTSTIHKNTEFQRYCEPFMKQLLAEKQNGGQGPKCMIGDQFTGWSQSWATKLQIPRYVVVTSPATHGYALYNYSKLLERDNLLERSRSGEDPILDLSGTPVLRLMDLSHYAVSQPKFLASNGDTYDQAEGLLFNTFYELEASAIDAFDAQLKASFGEKRPKMLPVGPTLPPEFFIEDAFFKGTAKDSGCIQWLDGRPPSSVIYIAFGSQSYMPHGQILELANALEASAISFLWILRVATPLDGGRAEDVTTLLPPGFQERTKEQGLVYSLFAPQLQILSHPATRGFLSHCGWNSSLESVCRGVPMIGWPGQADQRICCRVLEQAGMLIPIRPQLTRKGDLVKSDEVQKVLRTLMQTPEGEQLKRKALEHQKNAKAAVAPTGSSIQNIEVLVHDIMSTGSRVHHN